MAYNLQYSIFTEMPIINQADALVLFRSMDNILEFCISQIAGLRSTVFHLVDISAEIGSSLTHGRLIFNRSAAKVEDCELIEETEEKIKPPKNYGSSAKLEDLLTYNNESDGESIAFLKKVFKIYNCWTTGYVNIDDVKGLLLCRATNEAIINDFLLRTQAYPELCSLASRLRERFYDTESPGELSKIAAALADLEEKMLLIESDVGCSRSKLYSIRQDIESEMKRYTKMKETIYNAYLRIVYKVARDKATAEQQVLENFQNGAIGLLRAVLTYNPGRGVFSSYAKTWTMQHILLKLKEEANAIRLPISMWQTNNDLTGIQNKLIADADNYIVDPEDIAEEAGIDPDRVMKVSDYFNTTKVVSMENQNSLDSSDSECKREESYDPYEPIPFIDAHIDLLTPRQSFIIYLLYGMYERLPGDLPMDQKTLSKERLRQQVAGKMRVLSTEDPDPKETA